MFMLEKQSKNISSDVAPKMKEDTLFFATS
jgi:hypothetical protein